MIKKIIPFTAFMVFAVCISGQAIDTLTMKDCKCREYDAEYNICNLEMSIGQDFYPSERFILIDFLTIFNFKGNLEKTKLPHGNRTTSFFSVSSNGSFWGCGTLIFFIKKPKRA